MQRMVNQLGTSQDSDTLRSQLWVVVPNQLINWWLTVDMSADTKCNTTPTNWPETPTTVWKSWLSCHNLITYLNKWLTQFISFKLIPVLFELQKQRRMLRERLTNDFSEALKNFQVIQRTAAQKEKESVIRARANSGLNSVSVELVNEVAFNVTDVMI